MFLYSCHGLETELSLPNGNFKNEEDGLELIFVAGSWLQYNKKTPVYLWGVFV